MRRLPFLFVGLLLLLPLIASAQIDLPAPQFLYRDGNRLVLLDGYTGERTELPFDVSERDRFEWSPDGTYLLGLMMSVPEGSPHTDPYCLNLYDVDAQAWLYDQPLSCEVFRTLFSADETRLIYTTSDGLNGKLWLHTIGSEGGDRELYYAEASDELHPAGVDSLEWSPTEAYLTFVSYRWIMGGTVNAFVVMNMTSFASIRLSAPNAYYASYHPIWSPDEQWFLITLLEEYVTSGAYPITNHEGDVYLVNTETGDTHRLTYTPAVYETDVGWTDTGEITYSVRTVEVTTTTTTITTDEAMNVESVPYDEIVQPPPVEFPDPYDPFPYMCGYGSGLRSPDPNLYAEVTAQGSGAEREQLLVFSNCGGALFSVLIPENYSSTGVLIGWRPTDRSIYGIG